MIACSLLIAQSHARNNNNARSCEVIHVADEGLQVWLTHYSLAGNIFIAPNMHLVIDVDTIVS